MALPVLDHVATNFRVRRLIDSRAVSLRLHLADLLPCSMNDSHSFRSHLFAGTVRIGDVSDLP